MIWSDSHSHTTSVLLTLLTQSVQSQYYCIHSLTSSQHKFSLAHTIAAHRRQASEAASNEGFDLRRVHLIATRGVCKARMHGCTHALARARVCSDGTVDIGGERPGLVAVDDAVVAAVLSEQGVDLLAAAAHWPTGFVLHCYGACQPR